MNVIVLPVRETPGVDHPEEFQEVPGNDVLDVQMALELDYQTDAHFACYYIEGEESLARINGKAKEATDMVAAMGGKILCGTVAIDVDAPKKVGATPPWREKQHKLLQNAFFSGAAVYDTSGGYRIVWRLPEPRVPVSYERYLHGLHDHLRTLGIEPDGACTQWNRLYRLPNVPRYSVWGHRDFGSVGTLDWKPAVQSAGGIFGGVKDAGKRFEAPEGKVEDGDRTQFFTSMAGALRNTGLDEDELYAALDAINQEKCDPPYDDHNLRRIARWAAGKDDGGGLGARIHMPGTGVVSAEELSAMRIQLGSEAELADIVLGELEEERGRMVYDDSRMWAFDKETRLWSEFSEAQSANSIMDILDGELMPGPKPDKPVRLKVGSRLCKGVRELMQFRRTDLGFFSEAPTGIVFGNTYVNPASGEQTEARAEHKARFKLPFELDEDAAYPLWQNALLSWLEPLGDDAAAVSQLLAEWVGTALYGHATEHAKALLLYGQRASNGKTLFMEVIQALFPPDSVRHIAPQRMDNDYKRAHLYGARLNVVSEVPESDIMDAGPFKAILDGNSIDARQIYGAPFSFRPRTGYDRHLPWLLAQMGRGAVPQAIQARRPWIRPPSGQQDHSPGTARCSSLGHRGSALLSRPRVPQSALGMCQSDRRLAGNGGPDRGLFEGLYRACRGQERLLAG